MSSERFVVEFLLAVEAVDRVDVGKVGAALWASECRARGGEPDPGRDVEVHVAEHIFERDVAKVVATGWARRPRAGSADV